jgi:hypothetical protein
MFKILAGVMAKMFLYYTQVSELLTTNNHSYNR